MSDLTDLIGDLEQSSAAQVHRIAEKAAEVEAFRMKQDWRQRVSGARGLHGLPAAVNYDITVTSNVVTAEVGYDDIGQGELGNIAEYGTSTQGPKRPAGKDVLKAGADGLEEYLRRVDLL
jgi:hypothetical protein